MTPDEQIPGIEETGVPEGIIDFLQKRKRSTYPAVKDRYWISDIVGCRRKTYYKQLGIEEEELLGDVTIEGLWDSVRGDLLHKLTYAYKWRELDIENYIPLKDGRTAVLVGRLDMYDWRTRTVIDLKTTKFIRWQIKQGFIPKREHIVQVLCYDAVFSELLPIENLNIVYADMNEIVAYRIKDIVTYRNDVREWIKTEVQEIEDSVFNSSVPAGEVSGVCKYCRYQTKCYNDRNGLTSKPLSIPRTTFG
jgi:CRISPR/Cas system-associated exonuclease Cas4 (RecB family)